MKNSKWIKIIGSIIILLILFFIAYKVLTYKEVSFNNFPFQTNHYVYNRTEMSFIDTIVNSGLQKLNIDSVIIVIRPLINKEYLEKDYDVKAHILGEKYTYIIYIENNSRDNCIKILSHELIHLKQYYTGDLIIQKDIISWKGDTIDLYKYSYENRP